MISTKNTNMTHTHIYNTYRKSYKIEINHAPQAYHYHLDNKGAPTNEIH